MALAPEYYQRIMEAAPIHVIVTVLKFIPPTEPVWDPINGGFINPPVVHVSGEVEKVLRGKELVRAGDQIEFEIQVWKPGWPPFPPWGNCSVDYDELVKVRRLEIYLYGTPPKLNFVCGLSIMQ